MIRVEYEEKLLGTDIEKPHFSWTQESVKDGWFQKSYRITVKNLEGIVWDTECVLSDQSVGIRYEGDSLKPCTEYDVTVETESTNGEKTVQETTFETGLMDPSIRAWEGAVWTGAPEKYLSSKNIGVFVLETELKLTEGSRAAGIIFGGNDERLLDKNRNVYGLEGENYIACVIDVSENRLKIFRVGYAPEDKENVPFYETELYAYEDLFFGNRSHPLITDENRYDSHKLRIEVPGNGVSVYLDGVLVAADIDGMAKQMVFNGLTPAEYPQKLYQSGMKLQSLLSTVQLNPLGNNDITTFPRLYQAGYYAEEGTSAEFTGIRILNLRKPGREIVHMDPEGVKIVGKTGGTRIMKDPSVHSLPMFRRDIHLSGQVEKARLYVTSRGTYDVRINGHAVTDTYLDPGLTQYDKRLLYQTYDVTGLLNEGENGIGLLLSSGWWCDSLTFTVKNFNYFGDKEAFLLKLKITLKDGTEETIVSDPASWTYYGEGPYLYAGLFQGERYDGSRAEEFLDFSLPGCTLRSDKAPVEVPFDEIPEQPSPMPVGREWPGVEFSKMRLEGDLHAPVHEICRVKAVRRFEPRKGLFVYDLGQEMAGVPSIVFHGKKGEKAVIRYAEMLYPELPEYGDLAGTILTENYRDAESTDEYILSGALEGETYQPRFTFHGYRYIAVSGIENPPEEKEVESIQLSSVKKITGEIRTSDSLLNRLIENVRWSMLCNFISIPTDCPQRNERMGWAGDTHIFCRTATYEADTRQFYRRYLTAFRDLQKDDGTFPMIAPVGGGFGGITYESAMILIAWELYQQYGDLDLIREFYPSMKKWMLHMDNDIGMPGEAFVGPINDWLAFDETDNGIVWNAFYLRDAAIMKHFAEALHEEEDRIYFMGREAVTRAYWNGHFVEPDTGRMVTMQGEPCDTQCAYALGLAYDCFFDHYKPMAYEHLLRKVRESDYTIRTGFFGTPVLTPMLTEGGHTEDAYRLLLSTKFPSWLYPVTQGATTIWERWNSYTVENGFGGNNAMNSFNHYSYGAVLSWIYETVLGIVRDESDPGYKHFSLKPAMEELDYASGTFASEYGPIESGWKKTDDGYLYSCTVPANTTATLVLKNGERRIEKELKAGRYEFVL